MIIFYILIPYLLFNVGLFSDDFSFLCIVKGLRFSDVIFPKDVFHFVATPVEHFTHYIWYPFLSVENPFTVSVLKIFFALISFYMVARFFTIFTSQNKAMFISFLFLFYPSHDATMYWFIGYYLTLAFAFYLYSFYLAEKGKAVLAVIFSFLASFISYGSTPIALFLFTLSLLRRNVKKSFIILVPNILYVCYYLYISKVIKVGIDKAASIINPAVICKYFLLQCATFCDAVMGPSLWLKIYYSYKQLSVISAVLGVVCLLVFYKKFIPERKSVVDKNLAVSFIVLILISMFIFSLTGLYPQLAFNLGDRVTIFGSLAAAYFIVTLPRSRGLGTVIFGIFLFSILGISGHWKGFTETEKNVYLNIKKNMELKQLGKNTILFVAGNQYSRFGPFSHIEFFSEGWSVGPFFHLVLDRSIDIEPVNRLCFYEKGYLSDRKYGNKFPVQGYMAVYDSEKDILFNVKDSDINNYISSLRDEKRHWVQFLNTDPFKDIVLKLMPRLKYTTDLK